MFIVGILGFSSISSAQGILISTSGQTGTLGTNWSANVVGSQATISVTSGTATIHPSVIENYLNSGTSVVLVNTSSTAGTRINANILKNTGTHARLTFKDNGYIFLDSTRSIFSQTNSLDVIFWTDIDQSFDNTTTDYVLLGSGSTINTNGGILVLAGGSDDGSNGGISLDGIPDQHAIVGQALGNQLGGVNLGLKGSTGNLVTLNSNGGKIIIRGSTTNLNTQSGIATQGNLLIQSGIGSIEFEGISTTGNGIEFTVGAQPNIAIVSSSSNSPAITMEGNTTASNKTGLWLANHSAGNFLIQSSSTTGGGIYLEGIASNVTGTAGLVFGRLGSSTQVTQILSASGIIDLRGSSGLVGRNTVHAGEVYIGTRKNASTIQGITPLFASNANVIFRSGDFDFDFGNNGLLTNLQTTGSISFFPYGNTFNGCLLFGGSTVSNVFTGTNGVEDLKINSTHLLEKVTIGNFSSLGCVEFSASMSLECPFELIGNFIKVSGSITTSGGVGNTILIASKSTINNNANLSLTTGGAKVTLSSDADSSGSGQFEFYGSSFTITTNGGDIVLGGGNLNASGFARGINNTLGFGILLNHVGFNSGGGNIYVRGMSFSGSASTDADNMRGVHFNGSGNKFIRSGTGKIFIHGVSVANRGANIGIQINNGISEIISSNPDTDAIVLLGDADVASTIFYRGLMLSNTTVLDSVLGGGIKLVSTHIALEGNTQILASSGPIQLLGKAVAARFYLNGNIVLGSNANTPVPASSSNITLKADVPALSTYKLSIYTSGNFTFSNFSPSVNTSLNTSSFEFGGNGQKINNLTLMNATNDSGWYISNSIEVNGNLSIYGPILVVANDLELKSNQGNLTLTKSINSAWGSRRGFFLQAPNGNIYLPGNLGLSTNRFESFGAKASIIFLDVNARIFAIDDIVLDGNVRCSSTLTMYTRDDVFINGDLETQGTILINNEANPEGEFASLVLKGDVVSNGGAINFIYPLISFQGENGQQIISNNGNVDFRGNTITKVVVATRKNNLPDTLYFNTGSGTFNIIGTFKTPSVSSPDTLYEQNSIVKTNHSWLVNNAILGNISSGNDDWLAARGLVSGNNAAIQTVEFGSDEKEINFDFYRIDSWDNERMKVFVGTTEVLTQSFDFSESRGAKTQLFPISASGYSSKITFTTNLSTNLFNTSYNEHRVNFSITTPASLGVQDIKVQGFLNEAASNEAWAIANLIVRPKPRVVAQSSFVSFPNQAYAIDIIPSVGKFQDPFSSYRAGYTHQYGSHVKQVRYTVIAPVGSSITINGVAAVNGQPSQWISINNTTIVITSANGLSSRTYTIAASKSVGKVEVVEFGGSSEGVNWVEFDGVIGSNLPNSTLVKINVSDIESKFSGRKIELIGNPLTISSKIYSSRNNDSLIVKSNLDLVIGDSIQLMGNGSTLSLLANRSVFSVSDLQLRSFGDLIIASNVDNGVSGAIHMANRIELITQGGDITLGGSNSSGTGYATGLNSWPSNFSPVGIYLANTTRVVSNGGDVYIRGRSSLTTNAGTNRRSHGIYFTGDSTKTILSGAGRVYVDGLSNNTLANAQGIYTEGGIFTISSASPDSNAVVILGKSNCTGTTVTDFRYGLDLGSTRIYATANGGGIKLEGNIGNSILTDAIQMRGVTDVLAKSGPIRLIGNIPLSRIALNNGSLFLGSKASSPVPTSNSDVTLMFDANNYTGTFSLPQIATNGSFSWLHTSNTFYQDMTTDLVSYNRNGHTISGLTWGQNGNNKNLTHQTNAVTVAGPISLYGSTVYLNASITSTDTGDIFIKGIQAIRNSTDFISVQLASGASINKTHGTGTLTFQAGGRILQSGNIIASGTGKLNVVYWSDYNNLNNGGVTFANAANLITTTNGGHIWMGGSEVNAGASTWNGLTVGDGGSTGRSSFNIHSLELAGSFNTNGGDVFIWAGNLFNATGGSSSIVLLNNSTINAGSGDVKLISNVVNFAFPFTINTTGNLEVYPHQNNFLNVGSELALTGSVINNIFSGSGEINNLVVQNWNGVQRLKIGKVNGSNLLISVPFSFGKNLELIGSQIQVNSQLSTSDTADGNIILNGNLINTTAIGGIQPASGRNLTLNQTGASTFSGVISGNGIQIEKLGTGRLTLTGNHTFTGIAKINNGALQIGDVANLYSNNSGSFAPNVTIQNNGTLAFAYNQEVEVPNTITGTGTIEILGGAAAINSSILTSNWTNLLANSKVEEVLERISGVNFVGNQAYALNNDGSVHQKSYHSTTQTARFQAQFFNGTVTRGLFFKLRQNGVNVEIAIDQSSPYTNGTVQNNGNVVGTDLSTGTGRTYTINLASNSSGTGLNATRIYLNNKVKLSDLSGFSGNINTLVSNVTGNANVVYSQAVRGGLELENLNGIGSITNNGLVVFNSTSPATLSSSISGTGRLAQLGDEVTLTNNSISTGGWMIGSGKFLTVGNGVSSGLIQGNGELWGTLKWNRSDSTGISGMIQGPGNLVQMGSGTLTLLGSTPYTGSTNIQNGRLVIEADVPNIATSGFYGSGKLAVLGNFGNLFYSFPPSSTVFIDSNLSELVLGKTTNATNVRIQHPVKINGNITINATISINAALTSRNGSVTFLSTANTNNQTAPIVSKGLNIRGSGNFNFSNVGNNVTTLSVGTSSVRPIFLNFVNGNDLEIGNSTTDGILVNGTVTVETVNGNLILNKSIISNNTSASAINLVAGKSKAVGDTSGGNVAWNPNVSLITGTNGRVNIFSGTISGSMNVLANATDVRLGVDETSNLSATGMNLPSSTAVLAFFRQNGKVWYGATNTNFTTSTNWYPNGSVNNNESIVIHKNAVSNLNLVQNLQAHQVVFQNSGRKIILGNFNLNANDVIGGDASNFIQQTGTGKVSVMVPMGESQHFPVGRSTYNPVTISNRGSVSESFTVSVIDSATQLPTGRTIKYVNRTWDISKSTNTSSMVNFYFQWNPSEVVNGPLSNPILNHLDNGVWKTAYGSGSSNGNNLSHVNYDGGYSPFMITDGATPLPVVMKSFSANCLPNHHLLRWVTASEINNDRFEILQSMDGKTWELAGTLFGKGSSQIETHYEFRILQPKGNRVLYRLKQIDFDGTAQWSEIRSINCGNKNDDLLIFPNPTRGNLTINSSSKIQEVMIFNSLGQLVFQHKGNPLLGLELDFNYLPEGTYQLQSKSISGNWNSVRLMIQR